MSGDKIGVCGVRFCGGEVTVDERLEFLQVGSCADEVWRIDVGAGFLLSW